MEPGTRTTKSESRSKGVGEGDKGQTGNCRKKQGSGNADKKWVTAEVMETQHLQDRKGWLVLGLLEVKETSE